jgi:tRNA-binding EMAP/Myf-like protein
MTPAPVKPAVPFAALEALDVRVGTITRVEDVPSSSKLARLVVSFGDHTRTSRDMVSRHGVIHVPRRRALGLST